MNEGKRLAVASSALTLSRLFWYVSEVTNAKHEHHIIIVVNQGFNAPESVAALH
jgi:hypothetical protein